MKIAAIDCLALSRAHEPERQWFTGRYRCIKADAAIVIIRTDAGLLGIGEACAYGWPLRIRDWVRWLAAELVGRDPLDPAIVPHPNGRDWSHDTAVAGIDCALWDLRGKAAGRPVCELLAPGAPRRVRLYASAGCRYDWRERPEQLVEEAVSCADRGYSAYKFRIGTEWAWDGVTVDRFLGLAREVHAAVGGRMELMVDGNARLTEDQAMTVAKELDRLGFTWFEEPIPSDQIDGYVRLNAAVEMPISGGECFTTLEQFRPYLERRAYRIIQQDVGICGLTEAVRIARVAERYGVDVCPHNWHNGLMTMANGHFVAALSNPRVLELCLHQGPLQWDILAEPPAIAAGWLDLPDQPGLGVELAADLEARYPHIEGHYAIQVSR